MLAKTGLKLDLKNGGVVNPKEAESASNTTSSSFGNSNSQVLTNDRYDYRYVTTRDEEKYAASEVKRGAPGKLYPMLDEEVNWVILPFPS